MFQQEKAAWCGGGSIEPEIIAEDVGSNSPNLGLGAFQILAASIAGLLPNSKRRALLGL